LYIDDIVVAGRGGRLWRGLGVSCRQTDGRTDGHTDRQTDRHTDTRRLTDILTDTQAHRHTDA